MMKIFSLEKNTNPSLTVIYISSIILDVLKNNDVVPYQELKGIIIDKVSQKAEFVIPYSLSFLFTIGKIEYKSEIDSFSLKD